MNRTPFAVLAAVVLLAGCGPESELDLDLRAVSVTVPRLVTPAVEIVPEAPAPPPASLPVLPPLLPLPLPSVTAPEAPPVAPPVPEPCPAADQFAAPSKPATPVLPGPPAPGRYLQTSTGDFATAAGTGSLAGTTDVTVTALPTTTSSLGQRVDAWEVRRADARTGTTVERYQLVHEGDVPAGIAPGIYLVGLAFNDSVRGEVTFEPVGGGLHVLPDPVVLAANAAQYVGSATDPGTLTTLSMTRNVTGKKRVDLCGEVVDTYTVEMSGVLTSPDAQYQYTWTQQLAPAYGGADVEQLLSLTSVDGGTVWKRGLRSNALPEDVG